MAPAYEARDAKVASHARAAYAHAVRHGVSSSAIVIADGCSPETDTSPVH